MQPASKTVVPTRNSTGFTHRVLSAARGPWGRPMAKVGLALGTVAFLSWLGAQSAASTAPPIGLPDTDMAIASMALPTGVELAPSIITTASVVKENAAQGSSEALPLQDRPADPQTGKPDAVTETAPVVGVLPDGRVVMNVATPEELCRLPGVGPSRAQKIVELRK